ncbi:MAG TPA: exodeoxyribonuclease VII large subunit [Polyangiales bacterium]|nr:exodeoxyribonuclease VII large subunit [Polyangiales bacterium]
MRTSRDQSLTVAALNRAVRMGLEHEFANISVVGEISDLMRASSGHVYFTLNDEQHAAQIRVVLFRTDAGRTRAKLENGARVLVRGSCTLYEPRGSYQFQARAVLPAGEGDLAAQFRRLLEKLNAEGLTTREKRALPLLPRCIGLVTSESAAALHDVLRVARGRCPVRIVIAPCQVQGENAPRSIVVALRAVQRVPELDVVIVARGGGAAEDLWAFNDEQVARAIASCRVPVVSGVGHEIDTTIADYVADVRAATPSNAAELVVPAVVDLERRLSASVRALERAQLARIARKRQLLSQPRLRDPRRLLSRASQQLDELDLRLARAIRAKLNRAKLALDAPRLALAPHDPRTRLLRRRADLARLRTRLELSPGRWLTLRRNRLDTLTRRNTLEHALGALRQRLLGKIAQLDALSPLAVLSRGYAIALSAKTGRALLSPAQVTAGDQLRIKLHEGEVRAKVIE